MNRYNYIESLANDLVSKYKTRNPLSLLKQRDVVVMPFKGRTKLLGMYTIISNTRFVFYNPDLTDEMKNMVLAHELGHDILHQEEARLKQIYEFELFNIENKIETEANLFASHILIDEKEVENFAKLDYTYDQTASCLNVNVNLLLFKISEINRKNNEYNSYTQANNTFLRGEEDEI